MRAICRLILRHLGAGLCLVPGHPTQLVEFRVLL